MGVSAVHCMTACGCYCGSICSPRKRRLFWGILMGHSRVLLHYIVRVCDSRRVVLWVAVWVVIVGSLDPLPLPAAGLLYPLLYT